MLLSPGPGRPEDAGIIVRAASRAFAGRRPVLGVCLGHQAIGQRLRRRGRRGARADARQDLVIRHDGAGVFAGLPDPLEATRYHSLVVERESLPDCFEITAETADGTIMGLRHRELPSRACSSTRSRS